MFWKDEQTFIFGKYKLYRFQEDRRRSWGEKIQVWIKLCQKSGNQKINGINCSLSPQSLVWLLTSPRINDGAAITIICCTNIHLSNTPWRSLYSSPVIIINSSPFASVARVSAAAACSGLTQTRWADRRGAAGRSHSSWEHTSPPWPRSLKSEQSIISSWSLLHNSSSSWSRGQKLWVYLSLILTLLVRSGARPQSQRAGWPEGQSVDSLPQSWTRCCQCGWGSWDTPGYPAEASWGTWPRPGQKWEDVKLRKNKISRGGGSRIEINDGRKCSDGSNSQQKPRDNPSNDIS